MESETVQEIECAIDKLTPEQVQELYSWLDQHHPQCLDVCITSDIAAGHFDAAIDAALDHESKRRVRPL